MEDKLDSLICNFNRLNACLLTAAHGQREKRLDDALNTIQQQAKLIRGFSEQQLKAIKDNYGL